MNNNYGKRKSNPKFVTTMIITAAVMLMGTTAISNITTGSVLAYDKDQAKSDINECGNGSLPENVGCQNIDSQIQGDENSVAITGQQQFPTRAVEETATLIVVKEYECAEGEECTPPGLPTFDAIFVVHDNDGNEIPVAGRAPPSPPDSVTLPPGDYQVIELTVPPNVPGLDFVSGEPGDECASDTSPGEPIDAGETRTCIFTNIYAPEP